MGKVFYLFGLVGALTSCTLQAQVSQFGGPDRNGIYPGTDLFESWPDEGPELVGAISGIGMGYAAPAITKEGVYIAGMLDTIGYLFHFNHEQELVWKEKIGPEFNYKYVGSRATPTVEDERVYYTASMGDAVCLNRHTGEEIWRMNIMDRFNGLRVKWGYTESHLIYNEKIFYTAGGPGNNVVALDKMTGDLIWTSDIDSTRNSYCSPVIAKHNNKDYLLLNTTDYILMIDALNGDVAVKHPLMDNHFNHAAAPIYTSGRLFYSSGYGEGSTLFRIVDGQYLLDTIYTTEDLDVKISGMIEYDGTVIGLADRRKMWAGIDLESGETLFSSRDFKPGSFIMSDNRFFMYSDKGEVGLAIPSEEGITIVDSFQIPAGMANQSFAHPVIWNGILYIRYNNDLWLYRIG